MPVAAGDALTEPARLISPSAAKGFARAVVIDQTHLLRGPARIQRRDLKWLLPVAATLSYLLASDESNMQTRIRTNALARDRSLAVSSLGTAVLAGVPLLLCWKGWHAGDDYERDTGLVAVRAAVDSLVVAEAVRLIARRERPTATGGTGAFLQADAGSSSFPSLHSAAAWAIASAVAHRYPGWLTKVLLYGLASAVSISRVTSREHFPSDVLAGSALGWLIGQYVSGTARKAPGDHRAEPEWAVQPAPAAGGGEEADRAAGSAYVPLDSWIYGALDRLAAFGLIESQIAGLRPWTRAECRRQVREADAALGDGAAALGSAPDREARMLMDALRRELDSDVSAGPGIVLDSVYVRTGVISGPVLKDGFHFGTTWHDDFGRPFGTGWNTYIGFKARAESGRFFAAIQAEYQNAPGAAADSLPVRQLISSEDGIPLPSAEARAPTSRPRVIEAYAGVRLGDLEVSAGQQELSWGPGYDAALSFSTNAEPTKNLRISVMHPFRLPGFLKYLGDIRGEFVMGKLGGQTYTWRPWFNAQKVSFKLTENLEMGFTRWSIFWGVGHPATVSSLIRNFISFNSPLGDAGIGANDPGDRKGGFDFRYRIPGLRNWLTVYSDSYCDDDPSPLAAPRRAAISPGLYLSHVPGLRHLDLRIEAPSTTPLSGDYGGQFIYFNNQYRSGNTNYGNLLGSWVGRDARAIEGWSTYWFSARTNVKLGYAQVKGGAKFLPGGSTQSDATIGASIELGRQWYAELLLQYERFWVPVLGGPGRNVSGRIQVTWEPNLKIGTDRN
jgi:membrane-associated phospholipid phosphatase